MPDTFQRKYVVALCGVAVAILGIGAWLRPKKAAPKPPSSSETANLQRLVRREELRNMGTFFAEKAWSFGEHLRFVPETGANGVYWGRLGQVLSSGRDLPLEAIQTNATPTPPPEALVESDGGRWLLLVWIEAGQRQLEWTAGLDGGRRDSSCDGVKYRELIVNTALTPTMRGAAAFDLDGVLIGVVAQCGGTLHVVSAPSFRALLDGFGDPAKRLRAKYGVVAEVQEGPTPSLLIREVSLSGKGYLAGLRAGEKAPKGITTIPELLDSLQAAKPVQDEGLEPLAGPESGQAIAVQPGSPAAQLGLRTGDRLVRPSLPLLKRYLKTKPPSAGGPVMVVYERDGIQYAKPMEAGNAK